MTLSYAKHKFDINLVLKLIQKTLDGVEVFGFTSKDSKLSLLLNELPLLQLFTKKFREENLFLFSRLEDNQIDLLKILGSQFEIPVNIMPKNPQREIFLKKLNLQKDEVLTKSESSVLKLVLKGYSASLIGKELYRSKRTIEHHIERIKEKLSCNSKTELFQKAPELFPTLY